MNTLPEIPHVALPSDHEIAVRARAIFRASCEGTDSYHALRLGQARCKATDAGKQGFLARWIAPLAGGAIACCALAVGVVALRPASPSHGAVAALASAQPAAAQVTSDTGDEPADVASNQVDMVQNLDFYRWLAQQQTVASASAPAGGD